MPLLSSDWRADLRRAQRLFKLHIRTSQGVKYPKFLAMRAFPDNIRWLGSADLTDTGPYERTHKDAKVAAPFTNNDPEKQLLQV